MKSKKFSKKLELKKSTVAALNNGTMQGVRGGLDTEVGQESCPPECILRSVVICLDSNIRPCV